MSLNGVKTDSSKAVSRQCATNPMSKISICGNKGYSNNNPMSSMTGATAYGAATLGIMYFKQAHRPAEVSKFKSNDGSDIEIKKQDTSLGYNITSSKIDKEGNREILTDKKITKRQTPNGNKVYSVATTYYDDNRVKNKIVKTTYYSSDDKPIMTDICNEKTKTNKRIYHKDQSRKSSYMGVQQTVKSQAVNGYSPAA